MLSFFPGFANEELVYGGLARCSHLLGGVRRERMIGPEICDHQDRTFLELPFGLQGLVDYLPSGFQVSDLINDHTAYPYYARFLDPDTNKQLRAAMEGSSQQRCFLGLGTTSCRVPKHDKMMFCRDCAVDDRAAYGFATWKRAHQLAGVVVCPVHGAPLMESLVRRIDLSRYRLISLTEKIESKASPLNLPLRSLYKQVADDSLWLLQHPAEGITREDLTAKLRALLWQHGFHGRKRPDWQGVGLAMATKYADYPLLDLGLQDSQRAAPDKLLRILDWSRPSRPHPILYILLLALLDVTAQEFFSEGATQSEPRVETSAAAAVQRAADFPCPNPGCRDFEPNWPQVLLWKSADATRQSRCPTCSLEYTWTPQTASRGIVTVVNPGAVWDAEFAKRFGGPKVGTEQAAQDFSISYWEVLRHVARLRLRPKAWIASEVNRRSRWRISRTKSEANRPSKLKYRSNWHLRDRELAAEVPKAVARILGTPDAPKRVTQSAILSELNFKGRWVAWYRDRLPETFRAIEIATESQSAF